MGLTRNGSLVELTEKFKELIATLDKIDDKFEKIDQVLFKERILDLKDESWDIIRKKRDYLLSSTDWTMIPGATIDQAAWAAYRQILRDLPQTYKGKDPSAVIWPKKPSLSGPNTIQVK